MKCYHHNDLDGRCAGAIVYQRHDDCEMIEVDYKDDIGIEKIGIDEKIYVVDFSFKPETMKSVLKKTQEIIWIDHHKTAFEYNYGIDLRGIRDKQYSGCELTWIFLCSEVIPKSVILIGDRDKWAWKYGEETAQFNMGLRMFPHKPKDEIWEKLIHHQADLSEVIDAGKICIKFRDQFCSDYIESYGFETTFENYECFANGIYMFASEAFGKKMEQYDICLSYEYLGNKWIVGLYSEEIDVSIIAKKYGGGGHKGAAGFECLLLPFKKQDENE